MERTVPGPDEMRALGEALGRQVAPGDAVALVGDLGAGKTVFVQGLAAGLGYAGAVTSPTFTLIHIYEGGRATLYHADLYRLDKTATEDLGLEEKGVTEAVLAIEWPDRITHTIPAAIHVRIDIEGETSRRITVS